MKERLETFLPIKYIAEIFDALAPHGESRLVGGCVRELICNTHPKDIDIATQVSPEKVMHTLSQCGYHSIPTGIEHGTITAVKDHQHFEITTLRADVSTDGRRAVVSFTTDWVEDAKRRDFTFNAMYLDLDGNIYDFFNGREDLENKLVRFVGDPIQRIKEDYLRILRYFRFYAYIGNGTIDQASLDACILLKEGIQNLSSERLHIELFKILSASHSKPSLLLMCDSGVMNFFIPGIKHEHVKDLEFSDHATTNLAAILKNANISEDAFKNLAKHFSMSNRQRDDIYTLLYKLHLSLEFNHIEHKKMIYLFGSELYEMYISILKILHSNTDITSISDWLPPKLPLSGSDLIKKGLAGKQIGDTMTSITDKWIESDFTLSKEKLLEDI